MRGNKGSERKFLALLELERKRDKKDVERERRESPFRFFSIRPLKVNEFEKDAEVIVYSSS